MKLEVAKKYGNEIHSKINELNRIIQDAAQEGVFTELDVFQINDVEKSYPTVLVKVKISPTDLDD